VEFEISPLARQYAPWSISKLGVAENCPKQFEFKHVMKHEELVTTSDNKVGLAIHAVLEHAIQGFSIREAMRRALEKTPLVSNEMDIFTALIDVVQEFLRKLDVFCKQHGPVELLVEKKWGLTADGRGTEFDAEDVFFRGVLDLGIITADHDLLVIDHKTGRPYGLHKYRAQLNAYAVLGRANLNGVVGVRPALHYLKESPENRIQWCRYMKAVDIGAHLLPWIYEFINNAANQLDGFVAKPGLRWPCAWCAYSPVCAAYQELKRVTQG
jgi:RecB family exonuclease